MAASTFGIFLLLFALLSWLIDRNPGAPGHQWVLSWYEFAYIGGSAGRHVERPGDTFAIWAVYIGFVFLAAGIVNCLATGRNGKRSSFEIGLEEAANDAVDDMFRLR